MNCKPGDLAYFIRSDFPENVGHIVEVLSPFNGEKWMVKPITKLRATKAGWFEVWTDEPGTAADADLRPISGPSISDDTTTEETKLNEVLA